MKSHEEYRNSIDQKANMLLRKRKQRNRFITSSAACLALVVCAAAIMSALVSSDPSMDDPGSIGLHGTGSSENPTTPENPGAALVVHMNTVSEDTGASRLYFDPEKTYEETWDWNKIVQYLGRDITPDYIMPGLKINPNIAKQTVIFNNDGTMAYDAIWLEYYTEYPYADGSQSIGGSSTGIQIIASKAGHSGICGIYVWPEDMKESPLNNVAVKFGHANMGYGGTYEKPDFYYDLYIAEYAKDGISFQVLSSNISEQEFVKMVDSLTRK
jgi:hypothetical protein